MSGGIASGKSKVRQLLQSAGVATIDADRVGHAVLEPDGPAFAEVAARWPSVVTGGRIDRARLGAVVFGDRDELVALESITHPHIFDLIRTRVEEIAGPVVVEIPVLRPMLGEEWRRIVVDSTDEERRQRALERGLSEPDFVARNASQPSRAQWLAIADVVLPNHGSLAELELTVSRLVSWL